MEVMKVHYAATQLDATSVNRPQAALGFLEE